MRAGRPGDLTQVSAPKSVTSICNRSRRAERLRHWASIANHSHPIATFSPVAGSSFVGFSARFCGSFFSTFSRQAHFAGSCSLVS
ncbi:MAG: hypothetical protein ACI9MB_003037 [Verrucomicrobiales bacterium]|jgi:hypothetical protein